MRSPPVAQLIRWVAGWRTGVLPQGSPRVPWNGLLLEKAHKVSASQLIDDAKRLFFRCQRMLGTDYSNTALIYEKP